MREKAYGVHNMLRLLAYLEPDELPVSPVPRPVHRVPSQLFEDGEQDTKVKRVGVVEGTLGHGHDQPLFVSQPLRVGGRSKPKTLDRRRHQQTKVAAVPDPLCVLGLLDTKKT